MHIKRKPFRRSLVFEHSLTVWIAERWLCDACFKCGYVPRGPSLDRYGDALVSLGFRVCCDVFSVPNCAKGFVMWMYEIFDARNMETFTCLRREIALHPWLICDLKITRNCVCLGYCLPSGERLSIVLNWLILPVSICLFQRLSHACLSTARWSNLPGETADGSLNQSLSKWAKVTFWITVENPELIHAIYESWAKAYFPFAGFRY